MSRKPEEPKDICGQKFGRLMVLEYAGRATDKAHQWLCKCECGTKKLIRAQHLISGATNSCGCLREEVISGLKFKHGQLGTQLHNSWRAMRQRCGNPNHKYYANYGGRGIKVCESWQNSFVNFRDWALESGYIVGLTIDRIDNFKGYSPENCRWATMKEQLNNTKKKQKEREANA